MVQALWEAGLYQDSIRQIPSFMELVTQQDSVSPVHWMQEFMDPEIDFEQLQTWFQSQAPVYLVANPRREKELKLFLAENNIDYIREGANIKTQQHPLLQLAMDKGYCRVQDKGTSNSLSNIPFSGNVWDCCAGAGGKSLRLAELYSDTSIFSSDRRENSIKNLQTRFKILGITAPRTGIIDLSVPQKFLSFSDEKILPGYFDFIVADVPCSGSGTWRHTPEDAHFFKTESLDATVLLQQNIVKNVLPFLKPNGYLIYITCSVFDIENKQNIAFFEREFGLQTTQSWYTGGHSQDCDYIFRAVLKK